MSSGFSFLNSAKILDYWGDNLGDDFYNHNNFNRSDSSDDRISGGIYFCDSANILDYGIGEDYSDDDYDSSDSSDDQDSSDSSDNHDSSDSSDDHNSSDSSDDHDGSDSFDSS